MGTCHGDARLDRGDGIDFWGVPWGAGWIWVMGLIYGGAPWGGGQLDRGKGIDLRGCAPWGRATLAGSGGCD